MAQQRLIMAIGRVERALSRLEQTPVPQRSLDVDTDLLARHEKLKAETELAIADIDRILSAQAN